MNTTTKREVKENTNMKVSFNSKTGKVSIELDVQDFLAKKDIPLANSGKSYLICSTHGAKRFESDKINNLRYSVNVYVPKEEYDQELESIRAKVEAKTIVSEMESKQAGLDKLLNMDEEKLAKLLKLADML